MKRTARVTSSKAKTGVKKGRGSIRTPKKAAAKKPIATKGKPARAKAKANAALTGY